MNFHIKKLTLLVVIFFCLTGCKLGDSSDKKLSENRVADIILLEIEIDKIDSEITSLNMHNRELDSSSFQSQERISINQEKISRLESKKLILLNKLKEIYETEGEYQSKK